MNAGTLAGRVIIVTGASSGIGRAVALRIAREGAALALCGRTPEKLAETLARAAVIAPDAPMFSRAFDIVDDAATRSFVQDAAGKLGAPYALIHCAGGNPHRAPVSTAEPAAWDAQFALNCRATASVVRACWPFWTLNGGGRCVVVVSSSALFAAEGNGPYSTSKAAQKMLCDTLRKEGGPVGVGVTAVYPGGVDTAFRKDAKPEYMRPETVAEAIAGALLLPADATLHELTLRPGCETNFA